MKQKEKDNFTGRSKNCRKEIGAYIWRDFELDDEIYESVNTLVCRGRRNQDNRPVILKILNKDYPSPVELARHRHEYEITRALDLECVVKAYSLEDHKNTLAIILEDFGGKSLDTLTPDRTFYPEQFLTVAIKIADALGKIHAANIIHKDINPSNILINREAGQLKLIDFGISTLLPHETPVIENPNVLEGTLAYISPEQTGRMNRPLDYRTDFYSLGVTLYELLCQKLPFESNDPLEMVHAHIAGEPVTPHKHDQRTHKAVSDIVMKLLAKNAEDRYRSAWGIKADLEKCLSQLNASGKIDPFPLARHDISGKFQIFQKLYGREKEIETLMDAFERVAMGGREILMVAGYSGIGKTSLVREVYKPITQQRGYFISGKFDQFQRDMPYSAVVSAFQELVRHLLSESDARLGQWREKLLAALGPNGRVIIDVIREVELIIGPQPPVPELGPVEAQNRFNLVFQNFIRVFCQPEHPLVIFLDDLQWTDSSSLKLMELMMTDENVRHLFLIGAYRDNEIGPGHPLMITLDAIRKDVLRKDALRKQVAAINQLTLRPLNLEDVTQLIADSLCTSKGKVSSLAELVTQKTGGNPFFIEMFLKSLYEEKMLVFIPPSMEDDRKGVPPTSGDEERGGWQWDLGRIQALGITDNVVELMAEKIQRLSEKTRAVLQLASCIGNRFKLQTLAMVYQKPLDQTVASLQEAVAEGLVVPFGDAYKWISLDLKDPAVEQSVEYRFSHDRIQQAAYSLITETDRKAVHRHVGQHLLQNTPADQRKERIFDIVNQLNLGLELINRQSDRDELAKLNLMAGRKAKASAAYESAFNYLRVGIGLLGEDNWEREYDFTLAIYTEAAEAAHFCAEFDQMEKFADVVLQQARTLLDKVKVYEVKIQAYNAQYKLVEAMEIALPVLNLLSVRLPKKPNKLNILLGLGRLRSAMAGMRIEDLVDLPAMNDLTKLASMRVLTSVISATYFANPKLLPLLVFRMVNFSVKHGNAPESPFSYALYGLILCGVVGDINTGYRFGRLALSVLEQSKAKQFRARTTQMVNAFIIHWKEHARETLAPFSDAFQSALDTGDLEYASFSAFFFSLYSFVSGRELAELERDMARYSHSMRQLKHETSSNMHEIYRQSVASLRGQSEDPCSLTGKHYDEQRMLPLHEAAKDRTTLFSLYYNKLLLCYLFCRYPQAVKNAAMAEKYLDAAVATLGVPLFRFYDSLARLSVFADLKKSEQRSILKKVAANQKKMKKWARHAPMNHLHKFYLVEAERMRVLGKDDKAKKYYDKAIDLAKANEYINEESMANELAARFYLEKGNTKIARAYMQDARYGYLRWGATAKVKDLDSRYGQLLGDSSSLRAVTETEKADLTLTTTGMGAGECLDFASVMKASQAISGEIVLDKLLGRLMNIVIENAGAQKGALVLESGGKLLIEAEGTLKQDSMSILHSVPIEESNNLSPAIVNYVARTREYVILDNAAVKGRFTHDPYILACRPKSVLCAPIIYQSRLAGILYLENNLITDAFTIERMEMLKLLISPIGASLENARLYENLEDSELRHRELYENMVDIVILVSTDDKILMANPRFYSTIGIPSTAGMELTFKKWVHAKDVFKVEEQMLPRLLDGSDVKDFEFRIVNCHGTLFDVVCNAICIKKEDDLVGFQMVIRDITEGKRAEQEKKRLEAQLQQAQKMEAIGTLAGGIAHDFNNILYAAMGYTELALDDAPEGTLLRSNLQEVVKAGHRAKDLVKQILTFSRRTEHELRPVQVKLIVKEALKLLRASLPTTIKIKDNSQSDSMVLADPIQVHQVLMNLVTNAAHAMRQEGGILEVSLSNEECGVRNAELEQNDRQSTIRNPQSAIGLAPGPYLRLTVSDTGHGMSPEVRERIFDPFFTTKGPDEGTGMGLSVVHGIVKGHGGTITVHSEPGKGSTFEIYLPVAERELEPEVGAEKPLPTGDERILFIDDKQALVNMGKQTLERLGYEVVARTSSMEALELFRAQPHGFDLVISDMTMPNMTGDKLAGELMKLRADIPIVLCTGHSERMWKEKAKEMGIRAFVMKPLAKRDLADTIRKVLDA